MFQVFTYYFLGKITYEMQVAASIASTILQNFITWNREEVLAFEPMKRGMAYNNKGRILEKEVDQNIK